MNRNNSSVDVALPVLRKKRLARRRWIVLYFVQLLILLHIAMWLVGRHYGWFGGNTLTPIEPSEGMEFVKEGVINAGAIFFAIALLSTLIFGRWFCGWGCHIVLLQDLCYWMMRKLHIRPKPFRARLLMWFPFFLASYMYIWPLFYRFVLAPTLKPDLHWPGISTNLITTEYWNAFAPPIVAIPFLLICGLATVYVLGAKGFCTYGCPYGGFFKPLDAISPVRVRVNDNCQQCGKCTAACTSNVRVHEEVHVHKMVIDSGCMKTMDCIDACPNDALHIGIGANAIGKQQSRKYDLSLVEEVWVLALFLVGFFSFRGLYAAVPMLMAVGMSLVGTWVLWKAINTIRKPNVSFHHYRLRFHGKWRSSGISFVLIALLIFLFTIHSATVGVLQFLGDTANTNEQYEKALYYYKLSSPLNNGGIGIASDPNIDLAMATIFSNQGNSKDAEYLLRRIVKRVGPDERATMLLGQNLQQHQTYKVIDEFYLTNLDAHEKWGLVWEDYVGWLKRSGLTDEARAQSELSLIALPLSTRLCFQRSLLEMEYGDVEIAIMIMRDVSTREPNNPAAWMLLARSLHGAGRLEESAEAVRRATELQNELVHPSQ